MNIIVEGPDGSGKSTLISVLYQAIGYPVRRSFGPAADPAAFRQRVASCLTAYRTIFDRHPIVSEDIYGRHRDGSWVDTAQRDQFYCSSNLFICCVNGSLDDHQEKAHDSAGHLELVRTHHSLICAQYNEWALQHAHILYRKGEPPHRVLRLVRGELGL